MISTAAMIGACWYSNSVRSDGGAGVETATCVNSEETDDVPIVVQVDLPGVRLRGQPGHGPHLAEERVEERSEEHTSELQSQFHLVCRLLLETKKRTEILRMRIIASDPSTRTITRR